MASDDCLSASLIRLIASLIRLIDCLSASLIRWRSPRGTPRACAFGTAARQAHDHATCVPAQRRTCGLGAQAAHTGRDAPSDRAAGGRAQEQGRSQDVPSARHPSVKRRRPDQTAPTIPPTCISPQGGLFSRHGGHDPYPLVNGDDLRIQEKSVRGRFLILFGFCICGVGLNRAACARRRDLHARWVLLGPRLGARAAQAQRGPRRWPPDRVGVRLQRGMTVDAPVKVHTKRID